MAEVDHSITPNAVDTTPMSSNDSQSCALRSGTKKDCVFLSVPSEIRGLIYATHFRLTTNLPRVEEPSITNDTAYPVNQSLLLVSKQIRAEALPIFYREARFRIELVHSDTYWLNDWVYTDHVPSLSKLRHILLRPHILNNVPNQISHQQAAFDKTWEVLLPMIPAVKRVTVPVEVDTVKELKASTFPLYMYRNQERWPCEVEVYVNSHILMARAPRLSSGAHMLLTINVRKQVYIHNFETSVSKLKYKAKEDWLTALDFVLEFFGLMKDECTFIEL